MSHWFRFYDEVLNDSRVQTLAPEVFKIWVNCLCLASSRGGQDGNLGTLAEISFSLRLATEAIEDGLKTLCSLGFLKSKESSWFVSKWSDRQYLSDSSLERVKKYREKRYSMGLTSNGYLKVAQEIKTRDGHACIYCGATKNLCIDHILPVTLNGNDDTSNLGTACKKCNSGKAGGTPEQAGYNIINHSVKQEWVSWLQKRNVTVTVTPPEQSRYRADTEQSTASAVPCARDVLSFQKIYEAGSAAFPNLATANTSSIHAWFTAGCDAELDVIPEINRHAKAGKHVRSWSYFTAGIMDSKATRETPLSQGNPKGNNYNRQPQKPILKGVKTI